MEPTDFPDPTPAPITEISPSLANQLLTCQLRVGFARDPGSRRWKRPSTYSALGVAAHAVMEARYKRRDWPEDPGELRDALEALWSAKIDRGAAQLAQAWAPATPPPPEQWPGYALTRARTIRRAAKLIAPIEQQRHGGARAAEIELELRDPSSGLFGRADRIERDGSSTRVVDLKTGLHQDEPTESQRRQLLLYGVLVHRTSGGWPSSIAVEDASGNRFGQPLDPDEAEAALAQVRTAVAMFNAAIAAANLIAKATPDAERCRWCQYRVVCRPYWDSVTADWGHHSALGKVEEAGDSSGGSYVTITVEHPRDRAGATFHVAGLPAALPLGATGIAVTDWIGSPEAGDARARWSTIVRAW